MRYRRIYNPGSSYFLTLNLQNRKSNLLTLNIEKLRFAFRHVQKNQPFSIDAIVVLPDHLHLIMHLSPQDIDYSKRINLIKGAFSRQLGSVDTISVSRKKKRERGIWQRRFWEHCIRHQRDLEQHINYIHYNPVKHGYVNKASDWPYSSFHQYIQKGLLPYTWAWNIDVKNSGFGE